MPSPWTSRPYLYFLQFVYDLVYLAILAVGSPYLVYKMITSPKHRAAA